MSAETRPGYQEEGGGEAGGAEEDKERPWRDGGDHVQAVRATTELDSQESDLWDRPAGGAFNHRPFELSSNGRATAEFIIVTVFHRAAILEGHAEGPVRVQQQGSKSRDLWTEATV